MPQDATFRNPPADGDFGLLVTESSQPRYLADAWWSFLDGGISLLLHFGAMMSVTSWEQYCGGRRDAIENDRET